MKRPPPPLSEHAGFHYEAVVDDGWIVPAVGAGRCRWMEDRRVCKRPAVATLMRGSKPRPWDYCELHLYGRWMEGGKVMSWQAREGRRSVTDRLLTAEERG